LLGIEMSEKGVQGVESGGKVPESSVSFGRRAVNDARFKSPKRLSRSQLGARQERGYSVRRWGMATTASGRNKGYRRYFWGHYQGSLPEVLNIGDQGPSEGHRWVSECCNARCIYHLETA
jgi:hypothetical protein